MAVKSAGRKRKTTWSQWEERRVPSEYEAVTYKFHNHFRADPAPFELSENWSLNVFYKQHRENSPLVASVDDWEGFRDTRAFTYRRYIEMQKDREVYLDNLIDEFESRDHYRSLPSEWLDFLRDSYLPVRFPGHGMQMSAAYLGQMAPSAFVTNTFYFQLGNEMRRVQRQAYLAQVLAMDTERPDLAESDATRARWTDAPQWQGLRELIEKQLIAYDFGEAFASRNLVVRPIFDHIFNSEIATLAGVNGDDLLQLMHDDFRKHDQAYAEENTKALVDYAVGKAGSNADFLRDQVAKWLPLGEKAARGLAGALACSPGADSADVIVERSIAAQRRVMDECGL
ncbi:toluene hydroxylase [Labrys portucalensis]|uniref:Toluene hydroxylase n=1 Tax=Labrys neptuniae TaxID=376174 RepID=A0ABV6ZMX3_9HYPH